MSEAQKRNDRFSKSRQFAKELVADSIITDAAAQFIALMIEEIHKTKIKPLQDELARRAVLPPTTAQIMADPRVVALVEALRECEAEIDQYIRQEYPGDHPVQERYRQRDFGANPARIALAALAALAAIKEPKP